MGGVMKRYIIMDARGGVVIVEGRDAVCSFLKVSRGKVAQLIKTGEPYKGYTVDIYDF